MNSIQVPMHAAGQCLQNPYCKIYIHQAIDLNKDSINLQYIYIYIYIYILVRNAAPLVKYILPILYV